MTPLTIDLTHLHADVAGFCGDCGEPLYPDGSPGGGVGYAHAEEARMAQIPRVYCTPGCADQADGGLP